MEKVGEAWRDRGEKGLLHFWEMRKSKMKNQIKDYDYIYTYKYTYKERNNNVQNLKL